MLYSVYNIILMLQTKHLNWITGLIYGYIGK